jgi:cyclopropane fatty-acyl-phospholipid synthase-like methyltransferase
MTDKKIDSLSENHYKEIAEIYAQNSARDLDNFNSTFDRKGRIELGILIQHGLQKNSTLLDFGCGIGRLGAHASRMLTSGKYIGTDISEHALEIARSQIRTYSKSISAKVSFIKQDNYTFPVEQSSVDMMSAYSVFNYMENEDMYNYLKAALHVVKQGGYLVLSCLTIDIPYARELFISSSAVSLSKRWSYRRMIITSRELVEEISKLAGWSPYLWHSFDSPSMHVYGTTETSCYDESVCVLKHL